MPRLPCPETSFVGREQDVSRAVDLLGRQETRLLVLTGPGGIGKTRLALAAANAVADRFRDGVAFVSLAPLTDHAQLLRAIIDGVGPAESDSKSPRDHLLAWLRPRRLLLVLDNLETVEGATPEIESLAAACPKMKLLVTSRVRLGVPHETVVPVVPLPLPAPDEPLDRATAGSADAVRLFLDRAEAAAPGFATPAALPTIVAICRRLEGIPLALELAAARLRTDSPESLLANLDRQLDVLADGPATAPPRQRTMRDAVAWSYRMLRPDLQALLRRLAVFRDGFDAAAADAVAAAAFADGVGGIPAVTGQPSTVVLRLNRLVDHSLLLNVSALGVQRFALLEAVREFGWEQLATSGELATARRAHAEYCVAQVERTRPLLFSPRYREAMATLIREQHNVRAALAWAEAGGKASVGLRLCVAMSEFWYQCGRIVDGRRRVEAALAGGAGTPAERQPALALAGFLAWLQGDQDHSRRRHAEALALSEAIGDPWLISGVQMHLALVAWRAGDIAALRRLVSAAFDAARTGGDVILEAITLVLLAVGERLDGRAADAYALCSQARQIARETGFLWLTAAADFTCGDIALDLGKEAVAVEHFRACLAVVADLGDRWGLGAAIGGLACVAARRGNPARAARLFAAADALLQEGHTFLPTLDLARYERLRATARRQLSPRTCRRYEAVGRSWSVAEAVAAAQSVPAQPGDGSPVSGPIRLTPRQREVLRLLAEGLTAKGIASRLGITVNGVNDHIAALHHKLGVTSTVAAVATGYEHGLL